MAFLTEKILWKLSPKEEVDEIIFVVTNLDKREYLDIANTFRGVHILEN